MTKTLRPSPQSRPTPPCPTDRRWLTLAGLGSASLGAASVGTAGLVQITQTNLYPGGNFVVDNDPAQVNFFRDLTGDGSDDLGASWTVRANPGIRARLLTSAGLGQIGRATFSTSSTPGFPPSYIPYIFFFYRAGVGDLVGARTSQVASTRSFAPVSASGTIDITFSDPSVNGGSTTTGLLALSTAATGSTPGSLRVTIDRLIFDDAQPNGSTLPSPGSVAAFYSEFSPAAVPEPSGPAIFALGAAGILAHRRRKRKAALCRLGPQANRVSVRSCTSPFVS